MKKSDRCRGCRDNFYNGLNPHGIKECWNLKDAKVVWRKCVPYNLAPPWTMKAERVLSCYKRQGYAYVEPDRTC